MTMETILTVGLFWSMYFAVMAAVWTLHRHWHPEPWSFFDRTPFNCERCLTTWTLVASYISVAYILHCTAFGLWGCILSAGNAAALAYDNRMREETAKFLEKADQHGE